MSEEAMLNCIKLLGNMKRRIDPIIGIVAAALLAGVSLQSCTADGAGERPTATIAVNTLAVDDARAASDGDNTFMVLFWMQAMYDDLACTTSTPLAYPYLAKHAPQPVSFYKNLVYDTNYPYPPLDKSYLYATGYAPGEVLRPDETVQGNPADYRDYRKLTATVDDAKKGRYDFMGCDFWPEVYRGNLEDPFAQDKNKLYFRHLGAKLVFYADRDRKSMENKQFVRNVQITNLRMNIDGGEGTMYTPSAFEWKPLDPNTDFTASYNKVIAAVKLVEGNKDVEGVAESRPLAGYKATAAMPFAGDDGGAFILQKGKTDRIPIDGMVIDSCYVCNPIEDGVVRIGKDADGKPIPIKLKMDISAQMSFDPAFSQGSDQGGSSSDLTFTREWKGKELTIYEVEIGTDGKVQTTTRPVYEFKAGNEYRVYLHFYRTGVNLAGLELPWNFGGSHYINISDGKQETAEGQ